MTQDQFTEARSVWERLSAFILDALQAHQVAQAFQAMNLDTRLRLALLGPHRPGRIVIINTESGHDEELQKLVDEVKAFLEDPAAHTPQRPEDPTLEHP